MATNFVEHPQIILVLYVLLYNKIMTTLLPPNATLGRDNPSVRVLEWYLACVHPGEYMRLQSDLVRGVEIINPIPSFETMARQAEDGSYRDVLERAQSCFPRAPAIARDAVRWMLRWEPELTKLIGQQLVDNQPLMEQTGWSQDKHLAYTVLLAHMGAVNWESPAMVKVWNQKISYLEGASVEKRQEITAKAYWKAIARLPEPWQNVVADAMVARCPERVRASLMTALENSREKLHFGAESHARDRVSAPPFGAARLPRFAPLSRQ